MRGPCRLRSAGDVEQGSQAKVIREFHRKLLVPRPGLQDVGLREFLELGLGVRAEIGARSLEQILVDKLWVRVFWWCTFFREAVSERLSERVSEQEGGEKQKQFQQCKK